MADAVRGRWVPEGRDGSMVWKGPTDWTETVGGAEVDYVLERPVRFRNAEAPDGTSVPEGRVLGSPSDRRGLWRRPDGQGAFRVGILDIGPDRVVFRDDDVLDAQAKADPSVDPRTEMQRDLALDPAFMARMQDDAFADEVYASFLNREWRRSDGERHSISWRTSGALVADLRRRAESYLDWYPYGGTQDPVVLAEVEAHYARLGWSEPTREQVVADHHATVSLLDGIEARPEGDPWPPGDAPRPDPDDGAADGLSRLHRARRTGRVDANEYGKLSARLLYEGRADATSISDEDAVGSARRPE